MSNQAKKKTLEAIKAELLNSLKEIKDEDEPWLNEIAPKTKDFNEAIRTIKCYEEILKKKNVRSRNIAQKQNQLLKRFKESEEFFKIAVLRRSTINFKIHLYKFLTKYPVLKKSRLSSHYLKKNFNDIKKVCRETADLFGWKD